MKSRALCILAFLVFCALLLCPSRLQASPQGETWNIAVLDQILASVPPGQKLVRVDDMDILVSSLTAWRNRLAGISLQSAFDGAAPVWTSGNVYYTFSNSGSNAVPANLQKAFVDAAGEWATFANLHFIPRTTQSNYVTIEVNMALEGGQSAVGMVGGQQFLDLSSNAWNRGTICHEIGHTLGLVHEHQRSNRDSYVTILTNNVVSNGIDNFVLLANSRNQGAYDFLSIMHYARNYLSIDTNTLDTIEPLPAYTQYINLMGVPGNVALSDGDRAGMAAVYGAGPAISSVVTNTQDSGPGSLRTALYYAFDHPGTRITFNIPTNDPGYTNGVFTIRPSDQLPSLVNGTTIDGGSQPTNANSNPNGHFIQINGALAPVPGTYANGLVFNGTNCNAYKLVINGFSANGVLLQGSNTIGNVVGGCYLGIDPSGTIAISNGICPVAIQFGASGNTIGGLAASNRNVISGSAFQGLAIRDPGTRNNLVEGNYLGLNAAGTASLSNTWSGVAIFNGAQFNTIGGASAAARNVISGNGLQGITLSDPNTSANLIEGNFIGLNPSGTFAISNGLAGVNIFGGASGNIIGAIGAPNVISGNGLQGVLIQYAGSHNTVQANLIGLNPAGNAAIPNGFAGVEIYFGPQYNLIGGTAPGAGNIISGNGLQGVRIAFAGSDHNMVQGNVIGLNASGTMPIPNAWAGVEIYSGPQFNLIGGTVPGAGNVISGNGLQGVVIEYAGADHNQVQGNNIGLGASGTFAIPNALAGVDIYDGPQFNLVGGTVPAARNTISGNALQGIFIHFSGTDNNLVQGNYIGLNAAGTAAIPNNTNAVEIYDMPRGNLVGGPGGRNYISGNAAAGVVLDFNSTANLIQGNTIGLNPEGVAIPNAAAGVVMFGGAQSNLVGGIAPGSANLIAGNNSDGIQLFDAATVSDTLRANSLYGNNGVGIGIYNGANNSPGVPTLVSAVVTTNTTVSGTLSSAATTTFHLDFYASPPPAGTAEAKTYLGANDIVTDINGNASFNAILAAPVPIGQIITATGTDSSGDTSGLSAGVIVTGTDSVGDGITDAWRKAHFSGTGTITNSASCATCDPDHDGFNNFQEFRAGTDPNNSASNLRVKTVTANGTDIIVTFNSVAGITYRIEYRDNLVATGWSLLADQLIGTGSVMQFTDPGVAALPMRFYRVDVLP